MSTAVVRHLAAFAIVGACGGQPAVPAGPAGPAPHAAVSENELAVVTIDPSSVASLGIETAVVSSVITPRTREVGGVVTVPPGRALSVTAPVAGSLREGDVPLVAGARVAKGDVLMKLVPIAPVDRDLRAQSRRQRDASRARVEVATARLERTRTLVEQRGASQRALEEAEAELATAQAEDEAAIVRERMLRRSPLDADAVLPLAAPRDGVVRTVAAAPGQSIAAGALLFDVTSTTSLWLRVPLYPGELDRLALDAAIRVSRLGGDPSTGDEARPVVAPPSADPLNATVDLFYELAPDAADLRPGERVVARLTYRDRSARVSVPSTSIVRDFDGGSWVYECLDDASFRRRRVEVLREDEGRAVLGRGPAEGTCIVAVGALELLGAELGVAH